MEQQLLSISRKQKKSSAAARRRPSQSLAPQFSRSRWPSPCSMSRLQSSCFVFFVMTRATSLCCSGCRQGRLHSRHPFAAQSFSGSEPKVRNGWAVLFVLAKLPGSPGAIVGTKVNTNSPSGRCHFPLVHGYNHVDGG